MASPISLVLLRHGQSTSNRQHRLTGWQDVRLTPQGRRQAQLAGARLVDLNIKFDLAYTSALERAGETLNLVLAAMGADELPVRRCWQLNERHYGALEGYGPIRGVLTFGLTRYFACQLNDDVLPPVLASDDPRSPAKQHKYRDVDPEQLPRAESFKDAVQRVGAFWNQELRPALDSHQRLLIVAHNNSLRALVESIDAVSGFERKRIRFATARPVLMQLDANWRLCGIKALT